MPRSKVSSPPCEKVAIIGSGLSGLFCIKELKEVGIEPICFEKFSDFGGTWCYREEDVEGLPSVMSTTIINHSKEMGAVSNYPFPKEYPNYMPHWKMFQFTTKMAEEFDLIRHIKFRTEVVKVSKSKDYEETGRYIVTVKNLETDQISTDVYDGVLVCSGQFTYPKMPKYEGMENFQGKIIHSHSLKKFEKFRGKNVVIVGIGCSALDAAVEISSVAKQVYLSCRTPSYILSRVGPNGIPAGYCFFRRYITILQDILPEKISSKLFDIYAVDRTFNHKLFGIEPKYSWLCRDPIFNDHIASKILCGSVLISKDIDSFSTKGVHFVGDKRETPADVVIMATGYHFKIPFLDDGILEVDNGKTNLYKCMYPAQLKHQTLAFIGFILPVGPGWPILELQTRWAAQMFIGNTVLPSSDVMKKDVDKRHATNSKRYSPSDRMTLRVDYVPYADEIASQFGVKPNFWKMLFTDPRLFVSCIFGPSLPYQYRLNGPHKWSLARETILTAPYRMQYPLSRGLPKNSWSTYLKNFLIGHAFVFLILLIVAMTVIISPKMEEDLFSRYLLIFFCFVTILVILWKNVHEIFVNRFFWV